jgi:hypothetical protein
MYSIPSTAAAPRDLDRTEGRAVPDWRDALQPGTVSFHLPRERLAPQGRFKERHHNFHGLSIDDAVHQPFILQALFLDLPSTGAANDNLQVCLMLTQKRMQNQPAEKLRVNWLNVRAIKQA